MKSTHTPTTPLSGGAPTAAQIRQQFINFFVNYNDETLRHKQIPSASLIPENDPTVLFTTAGMHPLVPYLMGEPHPSGRRLVDAQKSLRTDDIDEVGDATHMTFFEMLGNWSLGDYFKEAAIKMSFELLTKSWAEGGYDLPLERLSVTCFEGDSDAPRDTESAEIWMKMGIPKDKIYFLPKKKNWWGPAGKTGPCGPDTEMFYDVVNAVDPTAHKEGGRISQAKCDPACDCGRYVEIWNDVFMQYNKKADGTFEPLAQKNVDTGLGLERMTAILAGKESAFETELFADAIKKILSFAPEGTAQRSAATSSLRIIADHLRAATFILGDPNGVAPSNVDQGYILRRLIRRAIRHCRLLGIDLAASGNITVEVAKIYIEIYKDVYPELQKNSARVLDEFLREEEQFKKTLERGLKEVKRLISEKENVLPKEVKNNYDPKESEVSLNLISGEDAFHLFETYGFPLEMIEEELSKEGCGVSKKEFQEAFDEAFKKHQVISRVGAEQKFSGGLADDSEQCKMHHTATHLLQQALRTVLGDHVFQKGSNVTKERLRFDFSHPDKVTPEQLKKVEDMVNEQITKDLPIHFEIMETEEAKGRGAIGLFEDKYAQLGNKVKIYIMGPPASEPNLRPFSMEVCGGPHVEHSGVLKHFTILKEEASSRGVRRIKAVVDGIQDVA